MAVVVAIGKLPSVAGEDFLPWKGSLSMMMGAAPVRRKGRMRMAGPALLQCSVNPSLVTSRACDPVADQRFELLINALARHNRAHARRWRSSAGSAGGTRAESQDHMDQDAI
jgi:hypothetical protein